MKAFKFTAVEQNKWLKFEIFAGADHFYGAVNHFGLP
jgi:hypothetical protein